MKKYNFTKKKLVNTYGAKYTTTDVIVTIVAFVLVSWLVCYLQKLNLMYSLLVLLSVACSVPFLITAFFKYKYEKKRFEEYCLYFESMKMFFKVHKKLVVALKETQKLFDEKSKMATCISSALEEIETSGDYAKALACISEKYNNTYLARLHSLLITGEKNGVESVYYNFDQINYKAWKEDVKVFQNRKTNAKKIFYFISLLSIGIALYSTFVFTSDEFLSNMLVTHQNYQLYTFLNLEMMMGLFLFVYVSLVNKKWIRSDE